MGKLPRDLSGRQGRRVRRSDAPVMLQTDSHKKHDKARKAQQFLVFFSASLWPFQLGREAPVLSDLGWRFLNGDEQAWSEGGGPGWWLLMLRVQRSQGRERG